MRDTTKLRNNPRVQRGGQRERPSLTFCEIDKSVEQKNKVAASHPGGWVQVKSISKRFWQIQNLTIQQMLTAVVTLM